VEDGYDPALFQHMAVSVKGLARAAEATRAEMRVEEGRR
jgi:hypothetical protein